MPPAGMPFTSIAYYPDSVVNGAIRSLLAANPAGLSVNAILNHGGISYFPARRIVLEQMMNSGELRYEGDNVWTLTDVPPPAGTLTFNWNGLT